MANNTTVDLIHLLKTLDHLDIRNNPDSLMWHIEIWADGSYRLVDHGNNDVIISDNLHPTATASDIHGLMMLTPQEVLSMSDVPDAFTPDEPGAGEDDSGNSTGITDTRP